MYILCFDLIIFNFLSIKFIKTKNWNWNWYLTQFQIVSNSNKKIGFLEKHWLKPLVNSSRTNCQIIVVCDVSVSPLGHEAKPRTKESGCFFIALIKHGLIWRWPPRPHHTRHLARAITLVWPLLGLVVLSITPTVLQYIVGSGVIPAWWVSAGWPYGHIGQTGYGSMAN